MRIKFDGVTIYEMSEHQLQKLAKEQSQDKELVKAINDLLARKANQSVRSAKEKRQIAPEMEVDCF